MNQTLLTKSEIIETVKNTFPKSTVMFIYYCGSLAFGLFDETSDIDVTVVLDDFRGNIHVTLGVLDICAFGSDVYLKKQQLDSCVPLYNRAFFDEVLSPTDQLIYLDEKYQDEYQAYIKIDIENKMEQFLSCFIEHFESNIGFSIPHKSHYHIFRLRGILERRDRVGRYELIVDEPWYTKIVDYKRNWKTEKGINYLQELKEAIAYIAAYKDRVKKDELG